MRAGLILDVSGLPYDVEMIRLREAGFRERLAEKSPGATVPALRHGDLVLSESLAIGEYIAELAPDARLWPAGRSERAMARMMASRMATGFQALRANCPMNLSNRFKEMKPTNPVLEDVAQLEAMWRPFLLPPGGKGPYLFGEDFGIVDAFFAPIAMRFYTYRIPVSLDVARYVDALIQAPPVRRWIEAAAEEKPRALAEVGEFAGGNYAPGDFPILND